MKSKFQLPSHWISKISKFEEFANDATQVTVRLKDGREIPEVLVSDATNIIAARGFKDIPFSLEEISDIFQSESDKSPRKRGGWDYWDNWK